MQFVSGSSVVYQQDGERSLFQARHGTGIQNLDLPPLGLDGEGAKPGAGAELDMTNPTKQLAKATRKSLSFQGIKNKPLDIFSAKNKRKPHVNR